MYNMDKELMDFVKWLPNNSKLFADMDTEAIITQINNLASSDEGKETLEQLTKQYKNKEMGIFKEGGKLHQLLCFKTGGKGPDCGCNKVKKAWGGTKMTDYITDEDVRALQNGTYRKSYIDEFGNKIEARHGVTNDGRLGNEIVYRATTPQGETLYATSGFDLEPSDKPGTKKIVPWGGDYSRVYNNDDTWWKRSERYYPTVINPIKSWAPMMQEGGEISRRDALTMLRTTGSSNKESRREYRDAKREARQSGLRGDEMRDAARSAVMLKGINRILPALDEVVIEDAPLVLEDKMFANLEVPTSLGVTIAELIPNDVIGGSFRDAFAEARRRKLDSFVWDNEAAKYKRYGTRLASANKESTNAKQLANEANQRVLDYAQNSADNSSGLARIGKLINAGLLNSELNSPTLGLKNGGALNKK